MSSTTPTLKATDLLAVKSRVSWGAIAAGAMVSLAIYFLLTLTGIAVGVEAAARQPNQVTDLALAIFSIGTLLIAMFFGGWATSRLAVGETKLEAVLYGVILWGVLFTGMLWLNSTGVRVGFGAILGVASGAVVVTDDTTKGSALNQQAANAIIERLNRLESVKTAAAKPAEPNTPPEADAPTGGTRDVSRQAAWYSLAGVVMSMLAVIFGSLIGSGDLPVPVPILGVRRKAVDPRL